MTNINQIVLEAFSIQKALKPECVMRGKHAVCKDMGWEKIADKILKRKGKIK